MPQPLSLLKTSLVQGISITLPVIILFLILQKRGGTTGRYSERGVQVRVTIKGASFREYLGEWKASCEGFFPLHQIHSSTRVDSWCVDSRGGLSLYSSPCSG